MMSSDFSFCPQMSARYGESSSNCFKAKKSLKIVTLQTPVVKTSRKKSRAFGMTSIREKNIQLTISNDKSEGEGRILSVKTSKKNSKILYSKIKKNQRNMKHKAASIL
jgi:hypothetical protein